MNNILDHINTPVYKMVIHNNHMINEQVSNTQWGLIYSVAAREVWRSICNEIRFPIENQIYIKLLNQQHEKYKI